MHQIRYFLAVARTLNFTQAADECHVSQPSLSRAVIKLEEELGGDLFRRERSLTHLTELGRMMLPLLTQTFESAMSAKSLASSFRKGDDHTPLSLALSSTIDLRLLIKPLSRLIDAMPGLELKFFRGTASDVGEQLKNGTYELGIAGPITSDWERYKSWVLFNETFHLVVHHTHRLANAGSVSIGQLAGERLLRRPYCEVAGKLSDLLAAHGLLQNAGDLIASDHDMVSLLDVNVGVALMPVTTPIGPSLRAVPIDQLTLECPVMLYSVVGRQHTPAAAGFIQLARAADWKRISASMAQVDVAA